jgi:hypothetical protein
MSCPFDDGKLEAETNAEKGYPLFPGPFYCEDLALRTTGSEASRYKYPPELPLTQSSVLSWMDVLCTNNDAPSVMILRRA